MRGHAHQLGRARQAAHGRHRTPDGLRRHRPDGSSHINRKVHWPMPANRCVGLQDLAGASSGGPHAPAPCPPRTCRLSLRTTTEESDASARLLSLAVRKRRRPVPGASHSAFVGATAARAPRRTGKAVGDGCSFRAHAGNECAIVGRSPLRETYRIRRARSFGRRAGRPSPKPTGIPRTPRAAPNGVWLGRPELDLQGRRALALLAAEVHLLGVVAFVRVTDHEPVRRSGRVHLADLRADRPGVPAFVGAR